MWARVAADDRLRPLGCQRRNGHGTGRPPPGTPPLPSSPRIGYAPVIGDHGALSFTVLGVIPARLKSTRLPRKVLRDIAGKPMIVHVWERARQAKSLTDLLVATDTVEVMETCHRFGITALMTSPDHPSGTDRVW